MGKAKLTKERSKGETFLAENKNSVHATVLCHAFRFHPVREMYGNYAAPIYT
jgi:hypothetical protein